MASGAAAHPEATSDVRCNIPDPIPVMVLARLADDQRAQCVKLVVAPLQDAVGRVRAISRNAGVRAVLLLCGSAGL